MLRSTFDWRSIGLLTAIIALYLSFSGVASPAAIDTFRILEGSLPWRVLGLVLEWASLHRDELATDWDLARNGLPLRPIPPLE